MLLTISIHFIRFQPLKFKPILKRRKQSLASFLLARLFRVYISQTKKARLARDVPLYIIMYRD